ncbi:hypothetical protein D5086_024192 [Populus alba]|uniref:Uncharacterized protein n=1 Tax=Populus alba TaxID=43335 RepID=A0ACC4B6G9_POPAL
MDWLPSQWKMKNISSSHSIPVCCLSPFTSPVTVSGKRKAVLVSALHCCLIDPEKPSSRSRYEGEEFTTLSLLHLKESNRARPLLTSGAGFAWCLLDFDMRILRYDKLDATTHIEMTEMDEKTNADFFHVIPLPPTSEVMDDVLEDSSAGTKDGMDGNVVELPFPPCDSEVPVSDGMLHFTTAMAKWIPNS